MIFSLHNLLLLLLSSQVPLSVPSLPGTPNQQPAVSMATTAISVPGSSLETGVEAVPSDQPQPSPPTPSLPTLPSTLTPAPFTVVRSPSPSSQKMAAPEGSTPHILTPHTSTSTAHQPQHLPPAFAGSPLTASQPHSLPAGQGSQVAVSIPAQLSASPLSALPGSQPAAPPTPNHAHLSQVTPPNSSEGSKFGATVSGLPTAPPTITLPSLAPTISLGPSPPLPAMPQAH